MMSSTSQSNGQYRCEPCRMSFNSREDLDKNTREEHK